MTTSFASLPIVDLSILSQEDPSPSALNVLSKKLYNVLSTTGFAYLVNSPVTYTHEEVFGLASNLFNLPDHGKWRLAKKTFNPENSNTYRGSFPPQLGHSNNLKEGFEIGSPSAQSTKPPTKSQQVNLAEPNVWPEKGHFSFASRHHLESLHTQLQALSSHLLALLARSLDKPSDHFAHYLTNSLSTLRLLHYPPQTMSHSREDDMEASLCCTPHTDSGLLTLLHQDSTGGLEVLNADGDWIAAPFVPGSIVLNIGDLMARISGGRFVATMHRVRASAGRGGRMGRLSVPFFFEPGEDCVVEGVRYGDHVRGKMGAWVEFQGVEELAGIEVSRSAVAVES